MRRRVALALLVLTAALGAITIGGSQHAVAVGNASGRVDALFDTAKGIVPGQVVKIAGARVGKVVGVRLTEDYKARIELEVGPGFTPFRANARCEIQPEGLISENFVQCDPGTLEKPELTGRGGVPPTVSLARTSVPVNLTDLFEIWEAPVRDRFRLLLNTLGAGVAGQGEDINALLRRANPTLGLVRDATGILDEQRDELQRTLVQAHAVTRELARRPERLQAFVQDGADVLSTTAGRRAELRDGLRRLPPALAAARPALESLDAFAQQGAPVSRRLAAAGPELDRLLAVIPPAASAGLPAVRALGATAVKGRRAIGPARPVVRRLRTFAKAARPTGALAARVLDDLRARGFSESFLSFAYYAAAATSRFDAVSHIFPAHIIGSQCMTLVSQPVPACDANYSRAAAASTRSKRTTKDAERPASTRPTPSLTPKPATSTGGRDPQPATRPKTAPLVPNLPDALKPDVPAPGPVGSLLDYLLGS